MSKGRNATRHSARERAFQVLYSLFFSPCQTLEQLEEAFRNRPDDDATLEELTRQAAEEAQAEPSQEAEEPLPEPEGFDWDLVKGVWKHEAEIDELVMRYSRHWRKDRMGKIELTILRIGVYETLFAEEVPPKVAIDEAVELAKSFAGGAAVGFVNGVLDAALRDRKRA